MPVKRSLTAARRRFLGRATLLAAGLGTAPAALAGGAGPPPWMLRPGRPFSNYGAPSSHEHRVIRWIAANPALDGNGVSWTPLHDLEGRITPNGLHFERHHNGVPEIDPAQHRLSIDGLVKRPESLAIEQLLELRQSARTCFIECGGNSNAGWNRRPLQARAGHLHGLVSCSEWTGVPLRALLERVGVDPAARWLVAAGADAAGFQISLPLAKASDDVLLALWQNGERLRPEQGYPLRLLVPGWEGNTHVKWLRRLTLSAEPAMSRYETAAYSDLLPDGSARQFSFAMQAKSLITRPSPGGAPLAPGPLSITGLAWSGAGRIETVEVSTDGGASWQGAELDGPVLPVCLTRFRFDWHWDGRPAVLQSRARDETGYRQPSRAALLAERGDRGYYHYNAIVSWQVSADGNLAHVYV